MLARAADIIIVGAGPIGLAHAWGIKKLNPHLNVLVYERYEEYQRRHTLIMEPPHLEALMKTTNALEDKDLAKLLAKIKADPNIRTNELESVFKKVAQGLGVNIINEQVKDDMINQQLFTDGHKPLLIIGADGTHSTIDRCFFPAGNQIKDEFDFVLQLRYEIKGEERADRIDTVKFYQEMVRRGIIANEYVGHYDGEKTPVTMQIMISKADFEKLKKATSKNPITPFAEEDKEEGLKFSDFPSEITEFLLKYLSTRARECNLNEAIDRESVRISVNEAPATHAEKIFTEHQDAPIVLVGDAGLGLSYFKGLNAGLQSTARLLSELTPALQTKKDLLTGLGRYQTWFQQDFAPKKIKEVATYSSKNIRTPMTAVKIARTIKHISAPDEDYDRFPAMIDYFDHIATGYQENIAASDNLEKEAKAQKWRPFPHRSYDLVAFWQWSPVPIQYTVKKILKNFIDYIKPYKSNAQFVQDIKQPLVGLANTFIGIGKIFAGIFTLDGTFILDGLASLTRGMLELATTPLTWTLKLLFRGLATLVSGIPKIEEANGMHKLAKLGLKRIEDTDVIEPLTAKDTYELLAICNDLHRKYDKALGRNQSTKIELKEHDALQGARKIRTKEKIAEYFTLFAPAKTKEQTLARENLTPGIGMDNPYRS